MNTIKYIMQVFLKNTVLWMLAVLVVSGCSQAQKQKIGETYNRVKIDADDTKDSIIFKAGHVVPNKIQYDYKKLEFTCFVHFGINTFTRKEWGNGFEDPKIFNLQNLDTDQWCRVAKEAGMKMVMFTAKHHDGFCLWQSRYTKHGVMSSPFKDGKGDVLKELSESCKKYGLKLGVYVSPADLYQIENEDGLYGNLSEYTERVIPRPVEGRPFKNKTTFKYKVDDYNEYMLNQLFECLTEYGPIHEVWFDGAHPKRKGGQKYKEDYWLELIRTLAPEAAVFGIKDIRWCGNESGATRDTEWDVMPFISDTELARKYANIYSMDFVANREMLGKADELYFLPGETDTSIREGWFYRDENTQRVRSADDVFDMYERCVGGNINLLLNVPPNRDGRFSDEDVRVLQEVGKRIKETYGTNLLNGAKADKALLDGDEETYIMFENGKENVEIDLFQTVTLNRFMLKEAIHKVGQRIEKHALDAWMDGQWQQVAEATNVGYKRIMRFPEVTTNKLRLRILESRSNPSLSAVSAHYYEPRPPQLQIVRNLEGQVSIEAKKSNFSWKEANMDIEKERLKGVNIYYTTDGSVPTKNSNLYQKPFFLASGKVNAKAFDKEQEGSLADVEFGILKKDWKLEGEEKSAKYKAQFAADANPSTYWISTKDNPALIINLNKAELIKGMVYTPHKYDKNGLMEKGKIQISKDGQKWKDVGVFDFGNLINDPTPRTYYFDDAVNASFVKIELIRGAADSQVAAIAEIDFFK